MISHISHIKMSRPAHLWVSLFLLISWICTASDFAMLFTLGGLHPISFHTAMLWALGEAAMLLWPILLLRGRWRLLLLLPAWIVGVWCMVNAVHFRVFQMLVPMSSALSLSSWNPFTLAGAAAALRLSDLLFILPPSLLSIYTILYRKEIASARFSCSSRMMWGIFLCGSMMLTQLLQMLFVFDHRPCASDIKRFYTHTRFSWYKPKRLYEHGWLAYNVVEWRTWWRNRHATLSEADRRRLAEEIAGRAARFDAETQADTLSQGLVRNARGRNLILIVVESLSSRMALQSLDDGYKAMPFLDSLLRSDDALTFSNVQLQAGAGRSSDGYLMYATGLLPLPEEAAAVEYFPCPYPSLATILPHADRVEIYPDDGHTWNHLAMSQSLHMDRVVNNLSPRTETCYHDSLLYAAAMRTLPKLKSPFFALLNTMTMHGSYTDPGPAASLRANHHTEEYISRHADEYKGDLTYLRFCSMADDALRDFIADLHRTGIYDQSVIVIASDHEPDGWGLLRLADRTLVISLIGTGRHGIYTSPVYQSDLYPTLLHLYGVRPSPTTWTGIGRSLLLPTPGHRPTEAEDSLSRLLIRGKFFNK